MKFTTVNNGWQYLNLPNLNILTNILKLPQELKAVAMK